MRHLSRLLRFVVSFLVLVKKALAFVGCLLESFEESLALAGEAAVAF